MSEDFSLNPEAPVLVIGSACIDIVGVLKGELQAGTSNPAQIRTSYGGVGRNVAENLSRLGQPVNLLTVVGEDQNGDLLLKTIAEAGVDVEAVRRTSQHPTGTYLGVVNREGELQTALDDLRIMPYLPPNMCSSRSTFSRMPHCSSWMPTCLRTRCEG